jgi:hypothetical protein
MTPDEPADLHDVRVLRAAGLSRPETARRLGLPLRRVRHLEQHWGLGAGATRFVTFGLAYAARGWHAAGFSVERVAQETELSAEQVRAVLADARGTWVAEYQRPPPGRRSRARGASADDLAQPKPGARGRAPTRSGPVPRAPITRKEGTEDAG